MLAAAAGYRQYGSRPMLATAGNASTTSITGSSATTSASVPARMAADPARPGRAPAAASSASPMPTCAAAADGGVER